MAKEYKMICTGCGVEVNSEWKEDAECPKCGSEAVYTGYTCDDWSFLSAEEKEAVKRVIRAGSTRRGTAQEESVKPSSGWINLLRGVLAVAVAIMILISIGYGIFIMTLQRIFQGIMIILGGILLAFISVAAMMVFLDMAEDVRVIRVHLSRRRR